MQSKNALRQCDDFRKTQHWPLRSPPQSGLAGVVDEQLIERLSGLSHITMADQEIFVSALAQCSQKIILLLSISAQLCARTQSAFALGKSNGSICVYILSNMDKGGNLRLYLPPFPFSIDALKWAEDRQRNFNGTAKSIVVWADQSAGPELMERGYRLEFGIANTSMTAIL